MLEYIIITKPAEKEDKNTIKLMNNQILRAGLKKDIEPLDEDLSPEFRGLNPFPNIEGSMHYYTRTVDILYQFDNKLKEIFPEAEYRLIVKHHDCCLLQPRIIFKTNHTKPIREAFPEFRLDEKIDETEYEPRIIPLGFKYEEDYKEHLNGYYDCRRCDPNPSWAMARKVKPKEDPHEKFFEQKVPKREKGSPKAHCIGTKTKDWPPDEQYEFLNYWKLSSEELLSKIAEYEKTGHEDLNALLEERRMRILTRRIKISLTDKPIDFYELGDMLVADKEPYVKLRELEEKGLIKEYYANH